MAAMPLALIIEFGVVDFVTFYVTTYPHLAFYPLIFFRGAGLALAYSWLFVPLSRRRRKFLGLFAIGAVVLCAVLALAEQSGPRMMVLEFNKEAQANYCMRDLIAFARSYDPETRAQDDELVCDAVRALPGGTLKAKIDSLFTVDFWGGKDGFSSARKFYLLTVFCILFVMLSSYLSILFVPRFSKDTKNRFLASILFSVFCLLLWFPARSFYNFAIKARLFENTGLVYETLYYTEIIIIVVFIFFVIFLFVQVFNLNANIFALAVQIIPLAAAAFAITEPGKAAIIFGFSNPPQPEIWLFWFVAIGVTGAVIAAGGVRFRL